MAIITICANHSVDSVVLVDYADAGRIVDRGSWYEFRAIRPELADLHGRRIWSEFTESDLMSAIAARMPN